MNVYYSFENLKNNLDKIYIYKYPLKQIETSKLIEKTILNFIKDHKYSNELNVIKPLLINIVSNYININNKLSEIKKYKNINIDKNNSIIAASILDNTIINEDKLISLQKKIYNERKNIKKIINFLNINILSAIYKNTVFSENTLSKNYFYNKRYIKIYVNNLFPILLDNNKKNKNISNEMINLLAKDLSEKYINLNNNQIKSLANICNLYINRLFNNIENNFIKRRFENCFISNSQNYYNRLIGFMLKDRSLTLNGFDHGGEKIFYKNFSYYENELDYANNYFVSSTQYSNYLEKINKNKVKINIIKSKYNHFLFNNHFYYINKNQNIIILNSSIDGENTGNIYQQATDDINKVVLLLKIRETIKPKYNFKIKAHPKSRSNILKNKIFKKKEFSESSLSSLFKNNNIFIFDYLGTTLIECLCAGKEIIFFDHGIYHYNLLFFNELSKIIHIIPIKYSEDKLNFEKKDLFYAIENPKSDLKKKHDFINKYFL